MGDGAVSDVDVKSVRRSEWWRWFRAKFPVGGDGEGFWLVINTAAA